jgi:arylsulfatase/uncharacterized sulfatase
VAIERRCARVDDDPGDELAALELHGDGCAIGRLVTHLKDTGQFDNTVFIVTSDNGPEPSDPVHAQFMNLWMMTHGYDWQLDNLGEKGSLAFIGPEWAAAAAAPGKLFKFLTSQGGLHVPLVMSGPGIKAGHRLTATTFVTDVTPTILELSGVGLEQPAEEVQITGKSLLPALTGASDIVRGPDEAVGTEVSGNAALYRGTYKIVRYAPPHGDNAWHLYDLSTDPGETRDLSTEKPELFASMQVDYAAYEKRMGVLPLQFKDGDTAQSLGLTGKESFEIIGLNGGAAKMVTVVATPASGTAVKFEARVRIDTPKEREYYQHGGILQYVLRQLAGVSKAA